VDFKYTPAPSPPITSTFVITNVVPGDFNYDGRLDLLVMGEDNPEGWWSGELKMELWTGDGKGGFTKAASIPSSTTAQPIPLDVDGDMKVDLLGFPYVKDGKSKVPQTWRNVIGLDENKTDQVFRLWVHPELLAKLRRANRPIFSTSERILG
jgi:integrin alpha FG-GAP repeat containing protein 1